MDFSRLRPFMADSEDDGPNTVLILKGFAGEGEIQCFMDALLSIGIVRPKEDLKQ